MHFTQLLKKPSSSSTPRLDKLHLSRCATYFYTIFNRYNYLFSPQRMHYESFWPLFFYCGQFIPYTLNLGQFNQILTVKWMVPLNIHVWWHVGCYVRWHVNKLTCGIFMMTWQVKKITKLHKKKKNKICFSYFSPSIYSSFSQHKKNLNPIYKNQPSG